MDYQDAGNAEDIYQAGDTQDEDTVVMKTLVTLC